MRKILYCEDGAAFEPEATRAMCRAFDEACMALHVLAADAHGRTVIAERIIELARHGVLDANTLRNRVVREAQVAA